ncbi:coadhesin, partial [Biomphalaria pfeifferi]
PRNISLSPPLPPPVDEYMSKSEQVKPGPHQLYSVNVFRFAAYLFGLDETESTLVNFYMMPAGFVSKPGGP